MMSLSEACDYRLGKKIKVEHFSCFLERQWLWRLLRRIMARFGRTPNPDIYIDHLPKELPKLDN